MEDKNFSAASASRRAARIFAASLPPPLSAFFGFRFRFRLITLSSVFIFDADTDDIFRYAADIFFFTFAAAAAASRASLLFRPSAGHYARQAVFASNTILSPHFSQPARSLLMAGRAHAAAAAPADAARLYAISSARQ
jgi:hypothetical protein